MRVLMLVLMVLLASPSLGQTPETITFEGLSGITPVAYKPGDVVPTTGRIRTINLAGGGMLRFRSNGGCKCAGLVTHMGTTAIVAISKKGKIQPGRFVEIRLRKASGARLDTLQLMNAGARLGDDPSTTAVETTFVLGYDNPGGAGYVIYESDGTVQPQGGTFTVTRTAPAPLDPDLTTLSVNIKRMVIGGGDMVFDDVVVSFGH